jgi:hypothetical protein
VTLATQLFVEGLKCIKKRGNARDNRCALLC